LDCVAEFVGEDNDGVPVYYERIATVDPKTLLKAVTAEDLIHYHVYCQEEAAIQLNDLSKKLKKPIFGNTVVEDMDGLGWKHYHNQALAILKQIIAIDEANYPEILKRYYLINAPRFFQVLWAVVKPWLDPRTLAKIRITSGVPAKELSKDVPMDQIPEVYGGTLKVTWTNPGGLFESSNEDGTNDTPVMEAIGRRDSLQLPIVVNEPNQTILWDFTVKTYDISFSIAYESAAKDKREVVLKPAKVSGEQKGEHTCEKPGTYYVIFDNTYSWTRGKEITYTLRKDDAPPADVDPETLKLMDLEITKWYSSFGEEIFARSLCC